MKKTAENVFTVRTIYDECTGIIHDREPFWFIPVSPNLNYSLVSKKFVLFLRIFSIESKLLRIFHIYFPKKFSVKNLFILTL